MRTQSGFTLIELTIVLAVIALLAGTIVIAQDMIHKSKVQNDIIQFTMFDSAVANFKDKYSSFPGDMVNATSYFSHASLANGDGDSILENADGNTTYAGGNYGGEYAQFWLHLSESGFVDQQFDASNNVGEGFPQLNVNEEIILATAVMPLFAYNMRYGKPNLLPDMNAADGARTFPPPLAQDFDLKLDDGIPSTGRFRANAETSNQCNDGTNYTISNTDQYCRPYYVMGTQP